VSLPRGGAIGIDIARFATSCDGTRLDSGYQWRGVCKARFVHNWNGVKANVRMPGSRIARRAPTTYTKPRPEGPRSGVY